MVLIRDKDPRVEETIVYIGALQKEARSMDRTSM